MDTGSQYLYMGIRQLGDGLAQGIQNYRQRQEKKKQDEAALTYLKKYGPQMGMDVSDDAALKAGIKAVGAEKVIGMVQMGEAFKARQEQSLRQKGQQMKYDMLARYADGQGKGVLSSMAQHQMNKMLQDPTTRAGLDLYGATGQVPDAEALTRYMGATARSDKPKPGSAGYKPVKVDGVGTIVQDAATGEAVPSSAIQSEQPNTSFKSFDEAAAALKKAGGKGQIQQSGKGWLIQAQMGGEAGGDDLPPLSKLNVPGEEGTFFVKSPDGKSWRFVRPQSAGIMGFFPGGGIPQAK